MSRRGSLIVYLGAAPGVGKTFAMLDEARRRQSRGTDVVVGFVETHGRPKTVAQLEELEILPRREVTYRGGTFTEMDVEAILERRPQVVLVDELAHTNVPGSRHAKRAEDVAEIRAAGIDVITTVNIQHLESLNDEVERITGIRQRETIPDEVVRTADQIQLVDMSPEALRRRLAHGNIYRAEQIDASLSSYFRVGNLTALRELALLWLADRVDDALGDYRRRHEITAPWPARERIVVAVTGGPESESLIRRGARIATRAAGAELLVVQVLAGDGLATPGEDRMARLQQQTIALGGTFHTVLGDDVAASVVDFATGANASMIVVGVSRRTGLRQLFSGRTGNRVATLAGSIDVHLVTHDEANQRRPSLGRRGTGGPRRALVWVAALVLPLLMTVLLTRYGDDLSFSTKVMAFLAATLLVALGGGLGPAIVTALSAFLLLNWFFTPPVGRWTIAEPENLATLLVFVAVAVAVASVVDLASRRTVAALRARSEATTIAALSRSVLTGADTAEAVTERLRETFSLDSVALLRKADGAWSTVAATGNDPCTDPETADDVVSVDAHHLLALRGHRLQATDRRVLDAFAVQVGLVLEYRRLRERNAAAETAARADAASTALLRAVSHDLRTPLATIRTAVEGLAAPGTRTTDERDELTHALGSSTTQLEDLIDNLLDLSRLQTGTLRPDLSPRSLEEVLPAAMVGQPPGRIDLQLDESTPFVRTDAGLLERVVANLLGNAVRHAPPDEPVRVLVQPLESEVVVMIVDRGPGVSDSAKAQLFEPFQRLDDSAPGGIGLGLAVARGLCEAVGATLEAEDTPGGGLTMVLTVPRADRTPSAEEER